VNKKEIEELFALVRAGLWEKDVELQKYGTSDFAEIMRLAEEQTCVGLVTAGLEHVSDVRIPQEWMLQFIGSTLQIEQKNKAMNKYIAEMVAKMRAAGIYTLLVKGQGVAQCYERPLWRSCGDIDFFLSDDNFRKAKDMFLPLASSTEKYTQGKHLEMVIDSWVVELHGWLRGGISARINRVLDDVQRDTFYGCNVRSWNNEGTLVFMLGKENDAFYVFVHFLNHFYKGGLGLRQICDWCRLLWIFRNEFDLKKLETRIREADLMTEWKAFGAFVVEYLGMPLEAVPFYSDGTKWKRKAQRIMEFVIKSGNFGHSRDMSYYSKYPFFVRKYLSMGRRVTDLCSHAMIFPLDSIKFFPYVIYTGVKSALKGA